MGIVTMKITQGTRVVYTKHFEFLRWDQQVNMEFWNIQLRECFMSQRFKLRKFWAIVDGVPNNLTQSAWGCRLWGLSYWRSLGSLVLQIFPFGFAPIARCLRKSSWVLLRL